MSGLGEDCRTTKPEVAEHVRKTGQYPPGIFDPRKGLPFSAFLTMHLPRRRTDWLRGPEGFGDSRYAQQGEHVPLDEARLDEQATPDDHVDKILEASEAEATFALLSERGRRILDEIVRPIADGESHGSVARRLGISRRKIGRRIEEISAELVGLSLGVTLADPLPADDLDRDYPEEVYRT